MKRVTRVCWLWAACSCAVTCSAVTAQDLPSAPDGFQVRLVATEPLVRNPCALVFDARGRMCVGMGPQYRSPKPDTPGDSVFILSDRDGDGRVDSRHQFATGFNSIQGLAWHGRDLWVANAPDLTIVRDVDGDDVADRYVRIYTDLGNLEHGLHGLHWGPDGRMYMSKGNSKGLTKPGRVAPLPFRQLWGVKSPKGAPDFPAPRVSSASDYERNYHDPTDDWGREGGVLVCDDGGRNLEIVSRGFRNPWDIAYDSGFHFQGTDNDQNEGDRVFTPFFGSHYGWGHPWSAHWSGQDHLPTARISGPVFHGSGTGMTFVDDPAFPKAYRGIWLFNDWLRRTTFMYRPAWDGARIVPEGGEWTEFVRGGKDLFKPTDLEMGPDGALYILGWGREYGATFDKSGQQSNEGRIFRVSWKANPQDAQTQALPLPGKMTPSQLVAGLDSSIEAHRVVCQEELIRRGASVRSVIMEALAAQQLSRRRETWLIWTLARLAPQDRSIDKQLAAWTSARFPVNRRVQALRTQADRIRGSGKTRRLHPAAALAVGDKEPRVRLAAILAIRRSGDTSRIGELKRQIAVEVDRVVFYAAWQTLRALSPRGQLVRQLTSRHAGLRLSALLALAEDNRLTAEQVKPLVEDGDERVRGVAALWMARGSGSPLVRVSPAGGEFRSSVRVQVEAGVKPGRVYYSTDGSVPTMRSPVWAGSKVFSKSLVLKLAVFVGEQRVGPVGSYRFTRLSLLEAASRSGVLAARAKSALTYRVLDGGLVNGGSVYSDRSYVFRGIPEKLVGSLIVQTANDDSSSKGDGFLEVDTVIPARVFVGHDVRAKAIPRWLFGGDNPRFKRTEHLVKTNDTSFRLYLRDFPAGRILLGGNTESGLDGTSNYLVIVQPAGLPRQAKAATVADAMSLLTQGSVADGKALFFATGGAGCSKCHRTKTSQQPGFGPDLASVVKQADPKKVIESILLPSREIKEGFAMQLVVTDEGKTITGILKEETGVALSLLQPDGRVVVVRKSTIDERISQKVSPMPSFDRLLTPRQVADLTAYLMSLKP